MLFLICTLSAPLVAQYPGTCCDGAQSSLASSSLCRCGPAPLVTISSIYTAADGSEGGWYSRGTS